MVWNKHEKNSPKLPNLWVGYPRLIYFQILVCKGGTSVVDVSDMVIKIHTKYVLNFS